jgi:hypothetical protein
MYDRNLIEKQARELRKQELRRLANQFTTWLSERLRGHHEAYLRRNRPARMRSVNATPA